MKRHLSFWGLVLAIMFVVSYVIQTGLEKGGINPLVAISTAGTAAVATYLIYFTFNRWLWSLSFCRKFHNRPVIKGTWLADLDGQAVELKVKQTFYDVSYTLKSREFLSESLVASLVQDSAGSYIYFVYISKPRKKFFNIHQIHYGTFRLHCQQYCLLGQYISAGKKEEVEFYPINIKSDPADNDLTAE